MWCCERRWRLPRARRAPKKETGGPGLPGHPFRGELGHGRIYAQFKVLIRNATP